MFLLVFFWGFAPLKAQQEGSTEIAKKAEVSDTLPGGGLECLERAGKILTGDKGERAAKFCLDLAKIEADRSKRVANEAADATKASRPQVILEGRYTRRYYYRERTIRPPRYHRDR